MKMPYHVPVHNRVWSADPPEMRYASAHPSQGLPQRGMSRYDRKDQERVPVVPGDDSASTEPPELLRRPVGERDETGLVCDTCESPNEIVIRIVSPKLKAVVRPLMEPINLFPAGAYAMRW